MTDFWTLYWLTRLDNINSLLGLFPIYLSFFLVFIIIMRFPVLDCCDSVNKEKYTKQFNLGTTLVLIFLVLFSILHALVPTTKEAAFIWGGSAVLEAAKSDSAKRIASKSVAVVEKYLDDLIKEEKKE